ncbi:AAA family ATPase [Pseudomonas sp. MWU13-2100]|uniref:AAA family ATPase n=1 Tax=Pseudomonas sp. MWU13-2100 TaxID=2935075 RepID=UPI00200F05FF|nr:AAA family ATPase [Pseudomonas sp. MWU13-2100]
MLKRLSLNGVGPAETFGPVEFAPRLNFITGDNGLGKSFLLDAAWWVLTRTWARGAEAIPRESSDKPSIEFAFSKVTAGDKEGTIPFTDGIWRQPKARPSIPGVVIYAGVDGSFSAWDPPATIGVISRRTRKKKFVRSTFLPMKSGKVLYPRRAPIYVMA